MEDQETDGARAPAAAPPADATNEDDNAEEQDNDNIEVIDIINNSLGGLLAKAQERADAASAAVEKKREELAAAQADAEEKVQTITQLREHAQVLADDEKWQSMYGRLCVWSKARGGVCNPRRNWKSKIDAEEKGEWILFRFGYLRCEGKSCLGQCHIVVGVICYVVVTYMLPSLFLRAPCSHTPNFHQHWGIGRANKDGKNERGSSI